MTPNAAIQYVTPDGRLTVAGMRLLENVGRVVPPAMTEDQRDAYDALIGEVVLNTTTNRLNVWVDGAWEELYGAHNHGP